MSRKILYSPGFGAGWSSWAGGGSDAFRKFMLTYQPLIDAIERGEDLGNPKLTEHGTWSNLHPALQQFLKDAKEQFNKEPYIGGARDLRVATVSGPFRIDEYDGAETVIERNDDDYIVLDDKP